MRFTGSGNSSVRDLKKNETCRTLLREQKKLERMVLDVLENGDTNLGNNKDILKQSLEVDKLIVNEMLRETEIGSSNLGNDADILKQSIEEDKLIVDGMLQGEANKKDLDDINIARS